MHRFRGLEEDRASLSSDHRGNFCGRRTAMEKLLVVLLALVILVGIALSIIVASKKRNGEPQISSISKDPDICSTPECIKTAAGLLSSMDTKVDPCEDFFTFSCGGWIKDSFLSENIVSRFTKLSTNVVHRVRELLTNQKDMATWSKIQATHWSKTVAFYISCMDTEAREKVENQPLLDDLEEFGGWPLLVGNSWNASAFNWTKVLTLMFEKGYMKDILISIDVEGDLKNASAMRLLVDQPRFGMPSRDYFRLDSPENKILEVYELFILKCALLLKRNINITEAWSEIAPAVGIEIQLALASLSNSERSNYFQLYKTMTLKEIEEIAPQVPWQILFDSFLPEGTTVGENVTILSPVPNAIMAFNEIISNTDPNGLRNLANYMMYRVVLTAAHDLDRVFRMTSYDFYNLLTRKEFSYPNMWEQCIDITSHFFSYSVVSSYIKTYFKEENRVHASEMLQNIRQSMKESIARVSWMDSATRGKALEKLNQMNSVIGYPPEILDDKVLNDFYSQLEMDSNYFSNVRQMFRFFTHRGMEGLHEPVDRSRWDDSRNFLVANAYYMPTINKITIPVGILQEETYDWARPKYINYGHLGVFIAHELTHGFDNVGGQFDAKGDWEPWMDDDSQLKFQEMSQCLVDQYNKYDEPSINKTVNGVLTLSENIADNGGLRLAYEAYQNLVSEEKQEQLLPGLPFTPNQLFWIAFGSIMCSKQTENSLRESMSDGHTPNNIRVLGVLSNFEEFSRDFQCKVGAPMNPVTKCPVWT